MTLESVYRECRPRSEFVQRAFRRSADRLVRLDRNVRWAGMPYVRREVSHTNSREAAGTSQSRASQPCEGTMATGRARPWPKEARLHASQGNENGKLIFSLSDPKQPGRQSVQSAGRLTAELVVLVVYKTAGRLQKILSVGNSKTTERIVVDCIGETVQPSPFLLL